MDSNLLGLDNLKTAQLVVASGEIAGVATPGVFTPSAGESKATSTVWTKFAWTNADVVGLGAVTTGVLPLFTIPKRTVIQRMVLVISGTAAGTSDLTVSVGLDGGAADGYMAAESCQTPAQWGLDASGDYGSLLTGKFNLPSMTAPSIVNLTFVTTDGTKKLKDVTGCTGELFVETVVLP